MNTLAEGWKYLTKREKELLLNYLHPLVPRTPILLPFTRISNYMMLIDNTPTPPTWPSPEWAKIRIKLRAMLCDDYVTLEELI